MRASLIILTIIVMIIIRCSPEEAMTKIGGYALALDMTDRQAQVWIIYYLSSLIYLIDDI